MDHNMSILNDVSLVTNNFGDASVFANILQDWFNFLGGKPGEVVVVDCGSDLQTQQVYWQLYQDKMIDKLQVIQTNHEDNFGGKETGYIQEYTAGSVASKPYILWFHIDTLPYRDGHNGWLEEMVQYLEQADVFAISGAFNLPSKHHSAWDGWYYSRKCSLNFALMKRSTFMTAVHEYAGDYILSGFKSKNPADETKQGRYLLEVAFERYLERHNLYTLCKVESPTWTIFHTNTHETLLEETRKKYLAREGIEPYIDLGGSDAEPNPAMAMYYGQTPPSIGLIKQIRIAFGKTVLGEKWRWLKSLRTMLA